MHGIDLLCIWQNRTCHQKVPLYVPPKLTIGHSDRISDFSVRLPALRNYSGGLQTQTVTKADASSHEGSNLASILQRFITSEVAKQIIEEHLLISQYPLQQAARTGASGCKRGPNSWHHPRTRLEWYPLVSAVLIP